jgi:hypothetical protein
VAKKKSIARGGAHVLPPRKSTAQPSDPLEGPALDDHDGSDGEDAPADDDVAAAARSIDRLRRQVGRLIEMRDRVDPDDVAELRDAILRLAEKLRERLDE